MNEETDVPIVVEITAAAKGQNDTIKVLQVDIIHPETGEIIRKMFSAEQVFRKLFAYHIAKLRKEYDQNLVIE